MGGRESPPSPRSPSPLVAPTTPLQIRPCEPAHWPAMSVLLEPVFRSGDTFPHDPAIDLRPHSVVAGHRRRQGIGSRLCQPSHQAARRLGLRAMRFSLVVSTLPGAFRHQRLGYVDAPMMVQQLVEEPRP